MAVNQNLALEHPFLGEGDFLGNVTSWEMCLPSTHLLSNLSSFLCVLLHSDQQVRNYPEKVPSVEIRASQAGKCRSNPMYYHFKG